MAWEAGRDPDGGPIEARPLAPRPRALRFWVWNAIALGGLGIAASASGLASIPLLGLVERLPGGGLLDAEMLRRVFEALRVPYIVLHVANLLASAGLVAGGVLCLGRRRAGRRWLVGSAAASIGYEGIKLWFLIRAWRVLAALLVANPPGELRNVPAREIEAALSRLTWVSVGVFGAFAVLLGAFYAFIAVYTSRREVRVYLDR